MNKHAYLILAHKNLKQLQKLIECIDSVNNDIYIHIDKKCREFNSEFTFNTKYSNIVIFNDIDVRWGDFSIVQVELNLLMAAIKNNYSYYHLLSGEDLPIKNMNYIYNFFEESKKEFIYFTSNKISKKDYDRIYYRHLMLGKLRTSSNRYVNKFYFWIDELLVFLQKILFLKKKKSITNYQRGSQWFSITNDFAKYVIDNYNLIVSDFSGTLIPDEMFIQTILINSKWTNNLYKKDLYNNVEQNMRYIDWNRGNPYVFTDEDFEYLKSSNCLFARKFDIKKDPKIIDHICEYIKEEF